MRYVDTLPIHMYRVQPSSPQNTNPLGFYDEILSKNDLSKLGPSVMLVCFPMIPKNLSQSSEKPTITTPLFMSYFCRSRHYCTWESRLTNRHTVGHSNNLPASASTCKSDLPIHPLPRATPSPSTTALVHRLLNHRPVLFPRSRLCSRESPA